MPLVVMCGLPSSGKTRRTEELQACLKDEGIVVHVVNEAVSAKYVRNEVFQDETKEKEIRGQLRSEVQKRLNKTDVVILDSANYIKGYRYELYCLSKASKTTHCVIHCDIAIDKAWDFNLSKPDDIQYNKDLFDALCLRFEMPDSRNRWDSPLVTVQVDDDLPFKIIYDAVFGRKAPPAHQSTQSQPLLSTNFLYDLDRITQEVIKAILDAQKTSIPGDKLSILDANVKLDLKHKYTGIELARLRRQFIVYTKMHPVEDCNKLSNMFVQYLNSGILQ